MLLTICCTVVHLQAGDLSQAETCCSRAWEIIRAGLHKGVAWGWSPDVPGHQAATTEEHTPNQVTTHQAAATDVHVGWQDDGHGGGGSSTCQGPGCGGMCCTHSPATRPASGPHEPSSTNQMPAMAHQHPEITQHPHPLISGSPTPRDVTEVLPPGLDVANHPQQPSAVPQLAPKPLFLARFTATWVHVGLATVGVSLWERGRRYREAVQGLKLLLGGRCCPGRRGGWWRWKNILFSAAACLHGAVDCCMRQALCRPVDSWLTSDSRHPLPTPFDSPALLNFPHVEPTRRFLLHMTLTRFSTAGEWWTRLSIDLEHLGDEEGALVAAESALKDPWVKHGDKLALQVCGFVGPIAYLSTLAVCLALPFSNFPEVCTYCFFT